MHVRDLAVIHISEIYFMFLKHRKLIQYDLFEVTKSSCVGIDNCIKEIYISGNIKKRHLKIYIFIVHSYCL